MQNGTEPEELERAASDFRTRWEREYETGWSTSREVLVGRSRADGKEDHFNIGSYPVVSEPGEIVKEISTRKDGAAPVLTRERFIRVRGGEETVIAIRSFAA